MREDSAFVPMSLPQSFIAPPAYRSAAGGGWVNFWRLCRQLALLPSSFRPENMQVKWKEASSGSRWWRWARWKLDFNHNYSRSVEMSSERRILSGVVRHFLFKVAGFWRRKFNSSGACLDCILNQSSHAEGFLIQRQPAAAAFSSRPKRESRDGRKVKRSYTSKQSRRLKWILSMKEALLNIQIPLLVYSENLTENSRKAQPGVDNRITIESAQKSILGVFSFSVLLRNMKNPESFSQISSFVNPFFPIKNTPLCWI